MNNLICGAHNSLMGAAARTPVKARNKQAIVHVFIQVWAIPKCSEDCLYMPQRRCSLISTLLQLEEYDVYTTVHCQHRVQCYSNAGRVLWLIWSGLA